MSEVPNFIAQQQILDETALVLCELIETGDEAIVFAANCMGPFSQVKTWAVRPGGATLSPAGPAEVIGSPGGAFGLAVMRLRNVCYEEGKGTWFGLELKVTPDGAVTAKYNYDTEPVWTRPIEPTIYVQEQEEFPRDLEHQPEWFRRRLVEGRVALEEWRRAQGR
jgi:hypothetical protein